MWVTFSLLLAIAAFFSVFSRVGSRILAEAPDLPIKDQLALLRSIVWDELWLTILRAVVAAAAFAVLAVFNNPLQKCWLGWDVSRCAGKQEVVTLKTHTHQTLIRIQMLGRPLRQCLGQMKLELSINHSTNRSNYKRGHSNSV